MKKQILLFLILVSCTTPEDNHTGFKEQPVAKLAMTEAALYDKILGNLVGSAIGDAMGAPTEMWSREAIRLEYGYVDGLDSMVREVSPEGTWKTNLPAGGTTDDTRWKELTYTFLAKQKSRQLNAVDFSQHILNRYEKAIDQYKKIDSFEPEPYEENTLHVAWLQEWARVAKPYVDNNLNGYADALSKFYGGEMVCAGLLYAPAVGAFYPGDAAMAYEEMYKLSIFDVGYARDISSLAAAMTARGMKPGANQAEVLDVLRSIDPQGYFKSRLVGRSSYRILRMALQIVNDARKSEKPMDNAFSALDNQLQDMPFHAGEIHLQVLTAMIFADFDFMKTLEFLVNYGRDNDTTAAIAGGILGAFHGFEKLPAAGKKKVILVCNEELDIDLERLARDLTSRIIELNR